MNRFVWFCIAVCVVTFPAQADFGAGLAAYDAGDYAAAREAWQPLAENGDPDALVALASLHVEGVGMRQDFILAAKLFRRAADQGYMVAQLNLGDYYARGRGVPRDLASAWMWLSLAARQGSAWSAARRDKIATQMSDIDLQQAARRLADWRPAAR